MPENKNAAILANNLSALDKRLTRSVDMWRESQMLAYNGNEPLCATISAHAEHLNFFLERWFQDTLLDIRKTVEQSEKS